MNGWRDWDKDGWMDRRYLDQKKRSYDRPYPEETLNITEETDTCYHGLFDPKSG